MADKNTEMLTEFSPRMFFAGLEGIWHSGEYESVEVKITFNKHRAADGSDVKNTPL